MRCIMKNSLYDTRMTKKKLYKSYITLYGYQKKKILEEWLHWSSIFGIHSLETSKFGDNELKKKSFLRNSEEMFQIGKKCF